MKNKTWTKRIDKNLIKTNVTIMKNNSFITSLEIYSTTNDDWNFKYELWRQLKENIELNSIKEYQSNIELIENLDTHFDLNITARRYAEIYQLR